MKIVQNTKYKFNLRYRFIFSLEQKRANTFDLNVISFNFDMSPYSSEYNKETTLGHSQKIESRRNVTKVLFALEMASEFARILIVLDFQFQAAFSFNSIYNFQLYLNNACLWC